MDIFLINPGENNGVNMAEHLGILSLKAFVTQKDYQADVLDMAIENLNVNDTVNEVLKTNPKMVGLSLLDDNKKRGISLIKTLRNYGYKGKIILGGYFPTFSAKELLRDFPEINFVVRGEGELTLAELMDTVINGAGKPYSEIMGLTYRENGAVVENPPRPLIKDLDILPPIDRKYAETVLNNGSGLRVYGTRGCWGQCTFCDIIGFYGTSPGKKWRKRSANHLVNEIESLTKKYNTNYFIFNDDQFLLKGKL